MIAVDLGKISYDDGLFFQETARARRAEGGFDDVVFLLEHEPVITIGKSGADSDLLVPEAEISQYGVSIRRVNRGGRITCHYPGQLVVYPIIDLKNRGKDLHRFVFNLEETVIRTLADFGVDGQRVADQRGVFVGDNKIAAVGIEVKNSVTMHGFSFNVLEDWSLYSLFIPCGITDKGITFLESCLSPEHPLDVKIVKERVLHHFGRIFSISIERRDINELADSLWPTCRNS